MEEKSMNDITAIKATGIIPVIRGATVENILPIACALKKGGINIIEITVETPGALAALEKAANELENVLVGAGTVLDEETARLAILSGAKFIVSPSMSIEVIQMTKRYGAVSIVGGLTPTEIVAAFENGADFVKVFPIHVFGPNYIKSLKDPLPHIPLIATGGVNTENIEDYIKAGVEAVGIGSSLVNVKKGFTDSYLLEITHNSSLLSSMVKKARTKLK
jgi:2-dehydro-3-deoxyphosphogluconate aldolase / (4S)-4-hydroxy-2-oxoglutarate aldolase